MSLAALPTLLLVPPLNCLVAACAGAALRHRRAGRVLLAAGLGGLVLLSLPLVAGDLLASLVWDFPTAPDARDPPRAIVILSADMVELAQGGDTVGDLTLARERAGAVLARATGLPILVTGGVVKAGSASLAALMARSLHEDFGVETRWREASSQDTWQNAALSAAMLRGDGVGTVYVVTHAWHMRRALIAFRAAGLRAIAAPVGVASPPEFAARNLVPSVSAWQESYYALHEWIGSAWYWVCDQVRARPHA
jgi:uncharacterized SAM-binding protein YcdF (DUF218 family)